MQQFGIRKYLKEHKFKNGTAIKLVELSTSLVALLVFNTEQEIVYAECFPLSHDKKVVAKQMSMANKKFKDLYTHQEKIITLF